MIEELWSGLIGFSSQFIVPNWGGLIALLPVLLLIPVVLFLTWTIYKFATAGPTRRGKQLYAAHGSRDRITSARATAERAIGTISAASANRSAGSSRSRAMTAPESSNRVTS